MILRHNPLNYIGMSSLVKVTKFTGLNHLVGWKKRYFILKKQRLLQYSTRGFKNQQRETVYNTNKIKRMQLLETRKIQFVNDILLVFYTF